MIAPSSPFDEADFDEGVRRLRERYHVSYAEGIVARDGFLAGSDARRLKELNDALEDPTVDALVAARGGYGASRLLDSLPLERVVEADKPLVGFSDVTALHAVWARAGVPSVHGPMVAALGRAQRSWLERWCAVLEGAVPEPFEGRGVVGGRATGKVIGGNLAVLAALAGTAHRPPLEGAVLLLEDIGEAPYRLDRALTTLRSAGWLSALAGVALGSFRGCDPQRDGTATMHVLEERLGELGVPVVAELSIGHDPSDREIVLGALAEIDGEAGVLRPIEGLVRER